MQLGRDEEARVALDHATALASTAADATHLRGQLDQPTKRRSKK